jgi:hypothetical protein
VTLRSTVLVAVLLLVNLSARAQGTDRLLSAEANAPGAGFGQTETGVAAASTICVAWNDRGALVGMTLQGWASQSMQPGPACAEYLARVAEVGAAAPCWEQISEELPVEQWLAARRWCEDQAQLAVCGSVPCY